MWTEPSVREEISPLYGDLLAEELYCINLNLPTASLLLSHTQGFLEALPELSQLYRKQLLLH